MTFEEFIENAFQKLSQRGWLKDLKPSAITDSDIAKFEKRKCLRFPAIFKAYLTAYKRDSDDIIGIAYDYKNDGLKINLINLYDFSYDISDLSEALKTFRAEFKEWKTKSDKKVYENLFPIAYMDGYLCLDLSRSDGEDCPVVWLEYGGFWEENGYFDSEGVLHGEIFAPDFKTFIDWYFCGALENIYESTNGAKVNREFYENWLKKNFSYHKGK